MGWVNWNLKFYFRTNEKSLIQKKIWVEEIIYMLEFDIIKIIPIVLYSINYIKIIPHMNYHHSKCEKLMENSKFIFKLKE